MGRLGLLEQLFHRLLIPVAVWNEVVRTGTDRPGAQAVQGVSWLERRIVDRDDLVLTLRREIGPGEAEAIALAIGIDHPGPLVTDDLKARRVARRYGIAVTGSAGCLLLAKERGLISQVRSSIDELRTVGLYLGEDTMKHLLFLAGEVP